MYSESDILSVTHVLGYNSATFGSVLHTILRLKKRAIFFYYKKTPLTRRFGSDVRGDRNYCISFFGLNK